MLHSTDARTQFHPADGCFMKAFCEDKLIRAVPMRWKLSYTRERTCTPGFLYEFPSTYSFSACRSSDTRGLSIWHRWIIERDSRNLTGLFFQASRA